MSLKKKPKRERWFFFSDIASLTVQRRRRRRRRRRRTGGKFKIMVRRDLRRLGWSQKDGHSFVCSMMRVSPEREREWAKNRRWWNLCLTCHDLAHYLWLLGIFRKTWDGTNWSVDPPGGRGEVTGGGWLCDDGDVWDADGLEWAWGDSKRILFIRTGDCCWKGNDAGLRPEDIGKPG